MARERLDMVLELFDLAKEIIDDLKYQLTYYRASVYKHETAQVIEQRILHLRTITSLLGDDGLAEPFRDYDATFAMDGNGLHDDCVLSLRVTQLLQGLLDHMTVLQQEPLKITRDVSRSIFKQRHKILKMCREGTPRWDFFRTL